jgi:hypothetical protein
MKRKIPKRIILTWVPTKYRFEYELFRLGHEKDHHCAARVWGPEQGWDGEDRDYHFAIFDPREIGHIRAADLRGATSSLRAAIEAAEAAANNKEWWKGKRLEFDRSQVILRKVRR